MRAEDFFNFARQVNKTRGELTELATRYEDELQEKPNDPGVQRALSMVLREKSDLIQKYGENADALSRRKFHESISTAYNSERSLSS